MPLKYLLNSECEYISLTSKKTYKIYKMNHSSNSHNFFTIIPIFNFCIILLLKKLPFCKVLTS